MLSAVDLHQRPESRAASQSPRLEYLLQRLATDRLGKFIRFKALMMDDWEEVSA